MKYVRGNARMVRRYRDLKDKMRVVVYSHESAAGPQWTIEDGRQVTIPDVSWGNAREIVDTWVADVESASPDLHPLNP